MEVVQLEAAANQSQTRLLSRLGLLIARSCISAWIGAAILFVIVGIIEVTHSGFDATTKDSLVSLRFPAFYLFGSSLLCVGWIGTWFATDCRVVTGTQRKILLLLIAAMLMLMAVDYLWIYLPLLQMITPPGQTKTAIFANYHEASKKINLVGLVLGLATAMILNWPLTTTSMADSTKPKKPTGD